jgi:hypothetical protein
MGALSINTFLGGLTMVVGMYYRFGLGIFMMLVEGQQVYGVTPGGTREFLGPILKLKALKRALQAWEVEG